MSGLPLGWESDYDGTRWFYLYKATGHIQYHFPKEGDEFPDYVDALSPAPVLAPEERLESQQQVKRHGSTYTGRSNNAAGGVSDSRLLPWQSSPNNGQGGTQSWTGSMSATARPVSFAWEGDEEEEVGQKEEDAVFRPESFMFLGPGTYNDVSPLVDEEEEAARRVIAGDGRSKGVSPDVSTGTTPQVKTSELKSPPASPQVTSEATIAVAKDHDHQPEPPDTIEEEPVIHMIDSREMPTELPGSEPWQDPVGRVPEMATGETPVARIETHPDPVEIGEGRELTAVGDSVAVVAELPDGNTQAVPAVDETRPPGRGYVENAVQTTEQPTVSLSEEEELGVDVVSRATKSTSNPQVIEAKTTGEPVPKPKYQPYKPGQVLPDTQPRRSDEMATHQSSLKRERSLMMGSSANGGQRIDFNTIPAALHVSNPRAKMTDAIPTEQPQPPTTGPFREPSPLHKVEDSLPPTVQGVAKFPSVLRPARGRAGSQPSASEDSKSDHGKRSAAEQQHPPSMHPGSANAQRQPEQPGVQENFRSAAMSEGGPYLPYRGPQHPSIPPAHDLPPRAATAIPDNTLAMQRATSVTTRKAVPSRAGPVAEQQVLKELEQPGKTFPPSMQPIVSSSTQQGPSSRERRHSSFSPSDVSPFASRSGSISFGTPLESPSPMEAMRRGSSAVSLPQSSGNTNTFTPSPSSLTPGSERQSVVSPLSAPSSRPGMSNSSSDMSYFTQGVSVSGHQQRQSPSSGLHRSQSMHQTPPPTQDPGVVGQNRDNVPVQSPSAPSHHLTSIEEHDEATLDSRSMSSQSPGLSRRHSLATSPDPSPRLPNQPMQLHMSHNGQQIRHPQYQGTHAAPQGPAFKGHPHGQHQIPASGVPPGPRPLQPQMHVPLSHGPGPHPPHMAAPPGGALLPQAQPSHHAYSQRALGGLQTFPPNNLLQQPVSASTAPTTSKDKKWTKWFKSSKSSASGTQVAQLPQGLNTQPPLPSGPAQQMSWPSNHPIPQGPPPGSPQAPAPWSPNQIRPHLHQAPGQLPPHGNQGKPLLPPHPGNPLGHHPVAAVRPEAPIPAQFAPQPGGPRLHRQSMPPIPHSGRTNPWAQRASGDNSGSGHNRHSGHWT